RYEWENKDARGLEGFLEEVALVTDIDRYDETQPKVSLLTIHNAKGLEFPVVMVGGVEEGVLPLFSRNDRESDIDEERRLFYVAVTRTINQLVLGYARDRFHWGGFGGWRDPSRFLKDIPAHLLTPWKEVRSGTPIGYNGQKEAVASGLKDRKLKEEDIRKGLIVKHPKFGLGTVVGVKKAGLDSRIEIDFDLVGVKILVLRYSPLEIIDRNALK
ncbi:MAG: 3'-5' exonuclease, partial [bacterium]